MTGSTEASAALRAWLAIPASIEKAIAGLGEDDLNLRDGGLSIRETVHHLVEANLVASNIMIAGLAKSGCTYTRTIRDLLTQEVEHAAEHLRTLAQTRVAHGR